MFLTKLILDFVSQFKKPIFCLVIFALIFGLSFPTLKVEASRLTDLQAQRTQLNQQITQNKKLADQKKQEAAELQKNLNAINSEIAKIQSKIDSTQGLIIETQNNIKDIQNQINDKEAELQKQKENQSEALRVIYENSQISEWEMVLNSNSFSEVESYNEYLDMIERKIEATIAEIEKIKADLQVKQSELQQKNKELLDLQSQQQAYKQGLDYQQNQKNKLLTDTKSQQKSLETQIAESQKLTNQVESEITNIMSAQSASGKQIIAKDRGTSKVGFQWPMDYLYISAYYGEKTPFQKFHSGIDLVNSIGSPVYAAASGTVTATLSQKDSDGHYIGYGNYITIGHNARYSTLYGHLQSFRVSPGDEVKQGDVIGYEGTTGWSTGPHLHFEVWEYGARQNPLNYLP